MLARIARALARDAAARCLSLAGLTRPGHWAPGRLTIITFHRVLPDELRKQLPLPGLCVTPEELAWVLGCLTPDFECLTLRDAVARFEAEPESARPTLAVTFDDAQRDNSTWAAPVLASNGVPATFFAPTDAVESGGVLWHDQIAFALAEALIRAPRETRRFLSERVVAPPVDDIPRLTSALLSRAKQVAAKERMGWSEELETLAGGPQRPAWDGMMSFAELARLVAAGHEVGSHSASHALLPQCTDAELVREMAGSRAVLERQLETSIDSFCYPNGDSDDRCERAVVAAGYRIAVTTRWGTNTRSAARLALDRCDIHPDYLRDRNGSLCPSRLLWRLSGLHPGLGGQRG